MIVLLKFLCYNEIIKLHSEFLMKKIILLSSLVFVSLHAQTLKNSVQEVLSSNPTILESLQNYKSTQNDIKLAKSAYYPTLDLKLGIGFENTRRTNQTLSSSNQSFNYDVYQSSLTYAQNLFDGFATTYQIKEQEYKNLSAAYSYIEKVNNTSFELVNTYIELMKNKELLGTAKENVVIDKEIFSKVNKLYDAGLTTLSEVNKIESSLALAESNLVVQENTLLDSSFNLERVLGKELNPDEMTKPLIKITLPKTREEALQFAINNNPSLLVSEYNIRLAQSTIKTKQSSYYPQLDVEISQAMNKNLSASAGNDDRFRAMAYLSFNLFRGFADSTSIQKSRTQVTQEIEGKNNIKRQILQGLNLSWTANEKLEEQLKYLIQYKDFSFQTLTLYSKEYDLGRRSLLDLLSAQNDFIKAKAQIIATQYNLLYAKYRILDAMGLLVQTVMEDTSVGYADVNLASVTLDEETIQEDSIQNN